jgi:hypothetical protein
MLRLWQASLIFYASVWTFTEALRWAVAKYGRQKKGLPPFVVTLALEVNYCQHFFYVFFDYF